MRLQPCLFSLATMTYAAPSDCVVLVDLHVYPLQVTHALEATRRDLWLMHFAQPVEHASSGYSVGRPSLWIGKLTQLEPANFATWVRLKRDPKLAVPPTVLVLLLHRMVEIP